MVLLFLLLNEVKKFKISKTPSQKIVTIFIETMPTHIDPVLQLNVSMLVFLFGIESNRNTD